MSILSKNSGSIKDLIKIVQENPELKVMYLSQVTGDNYLSYRVSLTSVDICEVWDDGERIYLDDQIEDEVRSNYDGEPENEDEEVNNALVKMKASGEIKKYIVVQFEK